MKDKLIKLLLEIICILAAIVYVIPIYYLLVNSFKTSRGISLSPLWFVEGSFTLSNFTKAWVSMKYLESFITSSQVLFLSLTLVIIISVLAAYALARVKHQVMNVIYNSIVSMLVLPFQLAMVPLLIMMRELHLTNSIVGIILVYGGWITPFATFLYTGYMRTIPQELEESAAIDGCGMLRCFISIFLPLLKPVTATVLIFTFQWIWNDLLTPLLYLDMYRMATLPVRLYSFYGLNVNVDWGLIFAGIFMNALPILIVFMMLQKYFVKGMITGAVKG